jgi:phage host-nuclease inhibitor protein Gam
MENRKDYIDKMAARLKEWDTEVQKLEVKAETVKADMKASYNQQINELRLKKEEAKLKLKKIQDAGEDAWEELKEGVEKSWNIFEDSIKTAWGKFN